MLYRMAAVAGIASAGVVLVNTAKRAGVLPATAATQLVAPFAQIFALILVIALFAYAGRKAGTFGVVAFAVNFAGVALIIGVEFVLNLVFPRLDDATITDLREGPLGVMLLIASVLFLVGTIAFAASLWRSEGPPRAVLMLYVAGAVPVSLRAVVPEGLLQAGLLVLAMAILGLSAWLWRAPDDSPGPIVRPSEAWGRGQG